MPSLRSASRERRIRLGWSICNAIPDRTYSLASRLVWAAESGISLPDGTHVPLTVSFMGGTPNYSPSELERSKLPEFPYHTLNPEIFCVVSFVVGVPNVL